jgi:hypothetical protein
MAGASVAPRRVYRADDARVGAASLPPGLLEGRSRGSDGVQDRAVQ